MLLADRILIVQNIVVIFAFTSVASSLDEVKWSNKTANTYGQSPNFVVFLVDDLGIGDVGCFGNDTMNTSNIDNLARNGAKLNHNLAAESICTPSRAAMLTGRYAIRSGFAAGPNEARVLMTINCPGGMPRNETTFAEVLQEHGYKTAVFGKWHLGLNITKGQEYSHHPMNHGFDEFYGLPLSNLRDCGPLAEGSSVIKEIENYVFTFLFPLMVLGFILLFTRSLQPKWAIFFIVFTVILYFISVRIVHSVYSRLNCLVMDKFEVVEQPIVLQNLTVRLTEKAKDFIGRNKQQPFLLYMPFVKVHPVLFTSPAFEGVSKNGRYGDNVEEMDWSVGEIVKYLDEEKLLENTFVYFTSDNGAFTHIVTDDGERIGGWNKPFKGNMGTTYEGGIRTPAVVMWKGHISEGITVNEPTNNMDVFTTMIEIAGGAIPDDRIIDGKNILPLLKQEVSISPHEYMFHYCGSALQAVRYRPRTGTITWKALYITPVWAEGKDTCDQTDVPLCACFDEGKGYVEYHDPPLLHDITNDPYEKNPIYPLDAHHFAIIANITTAKKRHEAGVKPVPKQLGKPNGQMDMSLQLCCNAPFCSCP